MAARVSNKAATIIAYTHDLFKADTLDGSRPAFQLPTPLGWEHIALTGDYVIPRWCTNIPGVVELSHASRGGRLQDAGLRDRRVPG
jgi:hypothetical protein